MRDLMDTAVITAKFKMREFLCKEDGEVNIISMVVLIGIAVALAMVFRDKIKTIMDELLSTIDGNTKTAVSKFS